MSELERLQKEVVNAFNAYAAAYATAAAAHSAAYAGAYAVWVKAKRELSDYLEEQDNE